jgi:hypothetical protein
MLLLSNSLVRQSNTNNKNTVLYATTARLPMSDVVHGIGLSHCGIPFGLVKGLDRFEGSCSSGDKDKPRTDIFEAM